MSMSNTRYIIKETSNNHVLIEDVGPWDQFKTVTNAVEEVVQELQGMLGRRRLYYIDSEGQLDEIVIINGEFSHFAPNRAGFK